MATLVLSTVGTVLGGPVGGAIGSLLGQSIDQQLFGPGPRRGPRLGDLAVQSSTYGTPIPRLFGTIRVAGSIVWSTDLKEDSQTQGAKGQPDSVTYSYSVSFAVALSCRRVRTIKRIWADGKLLRGAGGDFKVSTGFRFHPGGEDQQVDPLIASIEGVGSTPAYRGLALAVFEQLQLAEYGNRIPFLTFEVEADEQPPTVGKVMYEASDGAIDCAAAAVLPGYAAHGANIEAAVRPLTEHFGIPLFDDGSKVRSPLDATAQVGDAELGCSATSEPAPRIQRSQAAARSLPTVLTLSYYDPDRDYQTAQMRASTGDGAADVSADELPAVLGATAAKALVQGSLARRWAERDVLTVRIPPGHLGLEPGMRVWPAGQAEAWRAVKVTVEGMAVVAELRPFSGSVEILPADPGRSLPPRDVVAAPTTVALVELSDSGGSKDDSPVVAMASASPTGARLVPIEVEIGGSLRTVASAPRQAVIGAPATALGPGQSALIDLAASLDVQLVDARQWLQSCDDDALAAGENLAMIGAELIQFGEALAIGEGRFRLSRLLRGRRGSEWAMAAHSADELFVLIDPASLTRIDLSAAQSGASITAIPRGLGDSAAVGVTLVVAGEAMRPPSPVHPSAKFDSAGNLQCTWVRRSRPGWAWLDGVDAPHGESSELYRVSLQGSLASVDLEIPVPEANFTAAQVAAAGGVPLQVTVVQVGDLAVSRPVTLTIS